MGGFGVGSCIAACCTCALEASTTNGPPGTGASHTWINGWLTWLVDPAGHDPALSGYGPSCRDLPSGTMTYDEELADRIRELVATESGLTEKKMFGGLAFLIGGNMAVAASGQGGVLVRVDPARSDTLVASSDASKMVMRGRAMDGWLRVAPEHVKTKRQLSRWVDLGVGFARSLPAKR